MKTIFFTILFFFVVQSAVGELLFSFRPSSEPAPEGQKGRFVAIEETRAKFPEKFWFLNVSSDFVELQKWMKHTGLNEGIGLSVDKDATKYSKAEIDLLWSIVEVINKKEE